MSKDISVGEEKTHGPVIFCSESLRWLKTLENMGGSQRKKKQSRLLPSYLRIMEGLGGSIGDMVHSILRSMEGSSSSVEDGILRIMDGLRGGRSGMVDGLLSVVDLVRSILDDRTPILHVNLVTEVEPAAPLVVDVDIWMVQVVIDSLLGLLSCIPQAVLGLLGSAGSLVLETVGSLLSVIENLLGLVKKRLLGGGELVLLCLLLHWYRSLLNHNLVSRASFVRNMVQSTV